MRLLFVPALCLMCFACSHNNNNNSAVSTKSERMPSEDWNITKKIKAKIMEDSSISSDVKSISITTKNGFVTLTGSVSTKSERDKIGRIARSTEDVKGVDNQIMAND